jgi:hypothetical protein
VPEANPAWPVIAGRLTAAMLPRAERIFAAAKNGKMGQHLHLTMFPKTGGSEPVFTKLIWLPKPLDRPSRTTKSGTNFSRVPSPK